MLPEASAKNFPEALKAAREAKGFNYTQLAKLCKISPVMPSRYENREHGNHAEPNQRTWESLNEVLFGTETIADVEDTLLKDATMDELIQELKNRYAVTSITITP